MLRNWMLRAVGEGGGGATEVAEAPETETVEEVTETVEDPEETQEVEEPEETPAEETPGSAPKLASGEEGEVDPSTPSGRAFASMRREIKTLQTRLEASEGKLGTTSSIVDKLKPPEKDALESWYESLPDGNLESEKATEKETAEFKQDAGLMLRVAKNEGFRKAFLAPILPIIQAMFRSLDKHSWQNEQMLEAFQQFGDVEIGQPELDTDGNIVKPAMKLSEKLPVGLRHQDRILKHHSDMVQKQGGKWVPYRSAFDAVKDQIDSEGKAAAEVGGAAAAAATKRTLKEVTQRRTATGGPRSEVTLARGSPATPGKRTFDQIEHGDLNFLVP